MKVFQSKFNKIPGSSFSEVAKRARLCFDDEAKKTKRTPYIRSAYFNKDKVFLNLFWTHLGQKPMRERKYRLKYVACAFDLIRNSRNAPTAKQNPNKPAEMLYRFAGVTKEGDLFFVQIKENTKTGRKSFMSVFSA